MICLLDWQVAVEAADLPTLDQVQTWLEAALVNRVENPVEITVRVVDLAESQALNRAYRDKDAPTNVLSFPFESPPEINLNLLGDLVLCAPVIQREALEQGKTREAHWAHMLVHGCLHLLGHDHQIESEALEMETIERDILAKLGYPDPYVEQT